jgi:hypothetical protein
VTNIRGSELLPWLADTPHVIILGSLTLRGLVRTYGDVPPGNFLALIGSHGYLEIACAQGNAAQRLGLGAGKGRPLAVIKT